MGNYTETEYFESVRNIAREAIRAAQREGVDEQDVIHEAVDGSQWVIFHGRARFVCLISENEDAVIDQMGSEAFAAVASVQECFTRAAYWAMLQDVQDVLDDVREELHAEDERAADETDGGAS